MRGRQFQRIASFIISLLLIFTSMGSATFAVGAKDTFEKDGITYKVIKDKTEDTPGTVQVGNGKFSMTINKKSLEIPETVTNDKNETYEVVAIGDKAFDNSTEENSLGSVIIPASVISIGNSAFSDLTSLNDVKFAENSQLQVIGDNAFDTTSIKSISIPSSVKSIGASAFTKCSKLTSVIMSEGVTSLGDGVFSDNKQLPSITLPASLTSMGKNVFNNCPGLKNIFVVQGNTVYASGNGVLYSADKATVVKYPEGKKDVDFTVPVSVKTIGDYAFANNRSIQSVKLPEGVKVLGNYAFSKSTGLTSLELGNSLESIGDLAFWNCSMLETLSIPPSLHSIGRNAFYGCSDLKFVVASEKTRTLLKSSGIADDNITLSAPTAEPTFVVNGVMYKVLSEANDGQKGTVQIGDGETLATDANGSLSIPANVDRDGKNYTVVSVAPNAFRNSKLTSVTLPEGIKTIGKSAFRGAQLTSFEMPSTVEQIDEASFCMASKLMNITLSPKLKVIPKDAFSYSGLRTVDLPDGITEIGEMAFSSCSDLQKVSLPASLTAIKEQAFWCDEALREVVIPVGSKLKSVGTIAFQWCNSLKGIQLPDTLEIIEDKAFNNCTALKSIGLTKNNQLKSLGESAFQSTAITSFHYSAFLNKVGRCPLGGCNALTEITVAKDNPMFKSVDGVLFNKDGTSLLQFPANKKVSTYTTPSGVKKISVYAFQGTSPKLREVTIGEGVENIESFAFQQSKVESISISDSVTSIERLSFYKCPNLETLKLPSGLNTMVTYLIWDCESLSSLQIPASVQSIEESAVAKCPGLSSVEMLAIQMNSMAKGAFSGISPDLVVTVTNDAIKNMVVASGINEAQVKVKEPAPPVPGSSFTVNGVFYKVLTEPASGENGTVQIGDGSNEIKAKGIVTIPATIKNEDKSYNVISVASNALKNSLVTEFHLPETVKTISDYALYNASELTMFEIPAGVETIGVNAITGCHKLKAITYKPGSHLKKLGNGALSDNFALETIALPKTVNDIGECTMFFNYSLREVNFEEGSSWTKLPEGTFARDSKLERVNLPATVTSIGGNAFWNCSALKDIDLTKISNIGEKAFFHCTGLNSIELSNDIEELKGGTFEGCTGLKSVKLGSGLKALGDLVQQGEDELTGVFEGCTSLEEIHIPEKTDVIGKNTFRDCNKLRSIVIESPVLSKVGANAFYRMAGDYVITVQNEAVKNKLVSEVLVDGSHIRVKNGESLETPTVKLVAQGNGGLGKVAQVKVSNMQNGNYLLVQITNPSGVNSIYAVPVPHNGLMNLSYAKDNRVTVWLTERQPKMTAKTPNAGGRIFGSASL